MLRAVFMKNKAVDHSISINILISAITLFFSAVCFSPLQSAVSAIDDTQDVGTSDPYYIGLGSGVSFLKPETSSITLSTGSDNDLAYRIFSGYQLDDHWSAELFFSYLGKSEIRSQATANIVGFIDQQVFGIGASYQYSVDDYFKVFATGGIGQLQNKIQFVNAEGSNDGFIYAGAGINWNIAKDWQLRAEYDFYTAEVQLLSFNIVKYFGFGKNKRIKKLELEIQQKDKELLEARAVKVIKKKETCEDFIIDFKGVVFATGGIKLDEKARQRLDELAQRLLMLPEDITFEIRAHTDDTGSEEYNYRLSLARGRVVRDYLSTHGIALSRIAVHGYGEWSQKPGEDISSGRALSRRAELELVGVDKYVQDTSTCLKSVSR